MKEPPSNPDEFKKVSVSIPRDLLDKIDQRAQVEYRNRSNMIAQLLREELAAYILNIGINHEIHQIHERLRI